MGDKMFWGILLMFYPYKKKCCNKIPQNIFLPFIIYISKPSKKRGILLMFYTILSEATEDLNMVSPSIFIISSSVHRFLHHSRSYDGIMTMAMIHTYDVW
jgi:hypothetical protein